MSASLSLPQEKTQLQLYPPVCTGTGISHVSFLDSLSIKFSSSEEQGKADTCFMGTLSILSFLCLPSQQTIALPSSVPCKDSVAMVISGAHVQLGSLGSHSSAPSALHPLSPPDFPKVRVSLCLCPLLQW